MDKKNHAAGTAGEDKNTEAGTGIYIAIWAALIALTGLTVTAASLNLGKIAVIVCLAIAVVKSSLVLLFFMHLLYEKRIMIKILIPIAIVTLGIFIGLTFSDILTR